MAQSAVHILEDGTIEKCHRFRKRIAGCTRTDHWETVESARIHLDNKAYLAERAVATSEFGHAEKMFHHPRRLNAAFPTTDWSSSTVRTFGAQVDAHVAQHGSLPVYLWGVMSWQKNRHGMTYDTTVTVETVMDKETLELSRRWSVVAKIAEQYRADLVMRDVELDFDSYQSSRTSYEKLREAFACAVELASPGIQFAKPDDQPTEEVVEALMGRFRDMYGAVETAMRPILEVRNDELGDFTNSEDEKIVVDVEYNRSTFSAQSFKAYFRDNLRYNKPESVEAEIRVTDRRMAGRGETFWSLYRKDGVWSVVTATKDASHDNLTPTAEDVRSHVYWHVIREINPDDQEQAFAKSQYAADLFTAVEDELALFRAGAPQPR